MHELFVYFAMEFVDNFEKKNLSIYLKYIRSTVIFYLFLCRVTGGPVSARMALLL